MTPITNYCCGICGFTHPDLKELDRHYRTHRLHLRVREWLVNKINWWIGRGGVYECWLEKYLGQTGEQSGRIVPQWGCTNPIVTTGTEQPQSKKKEP